MKCWGFLAAIALEMGRFGRIPVTKTYTASAELQWPLRHYAPQKHFACIFSTVLIL
jgi:hypothetical protein